MKENKKNSSHNIDISKIVYEKKKRNTFNYTGGL